MNQIFKNSQIDMNISIITFAKKVEIWSEEEVIDFYPSEKPSKDVTKLHPPLFIEVDTFGIIVKRSLIDGGATLNIATTHLLLQFDLDVLPPREETNMRVKVFDGIPQSVQESLHFLSKSITKYLTLFFILRRESLHLTLFLGDLG